MVELDDTDYLPKRNSAIELIDYWKKGQKQLDQFWEVWRNDYLLSLRETLPLCHKGSRLQIFRQPTIGEVVIVKEEYLPCRMWKLARIKEFILSEDGQIQSAVVELPNKHFITRLVNHLFPLEIPLTVNDVTQEGIKETFTDEVTDNRNARSPRSAALQARSRIAEMFNDEATTVCFMFPRECHGETPT